MGKIEDFRKLMIRRGYDAYIIPTSDYHNSEYVSDYFKGRQYLSDFTGSAGTLVVTLEKAFLWTDGRYYIQAAKQIENNNIELMKMGAENVPTIEEFLGNLLKERDVLAFDGRTINSSTANSIINKLPLGVNVVTDVDLIDEMWAERPKMPYSVLYKLDEFYSGKAFKDKIVEIREIMNSNKAEMHIITALEDQAWLYNLRGDDVLHTPVFLSYTVITNDSVTLYVDQTKIDLTVEKYLDNNDVHIKPYFDIYQDVKTFKNKLIQIDLNKVNYQIYSSLKNANSIINLPDPSLLLKSIKNEVEIKNTKEAHILDGVAMTKFMYYLKTNYQNGTEMTEISVSDYLESLRRKNKSCVDLSFNTICAFKDHAAMMHYSATEETNAKIEGNGFLLVDSGGHYLEGTTDITRTFALGKINDQMKVHFTAVLKSVIALSQAVFMKGCNGQNLDILARGPIWNMLIDYKCGTGHGVGYLLSVHEAPNGFRWKIVPERNDSHPFVPGMITTNEPGIYLEGKYGIRTENEMLCIEKGSSEFGEFLGFETITFCPIDIDAIKPSLLTKYEKEWLNSYHEQVFSKISPYLTEEEKAWLTEYTRKI